MQEDTNNQATGDLNTVDVDHGAVLTWQAQGGNSVISGTYGTLNIDQAGTWTYNLDNSRTATQNLAQGQTKIDTFVVQVTDEHGAFDTETVTINVAGSNDAPLMETGPVSGPSPKA